MNLRLTFTALLSLIFLACLGQNSPDTLSTTYKRLHVKTVTMFHKNNYEPANVDTTVEHYNTDGLPVKIVWMGINNIYYYNDKNQVVKDSVFDPFKDGPSYYFYRDDGRLLKSVTMNNGAPGDTVRWTYFTTNGKVSGAQSYQRSSKGETYSITHYKYNKYGLAEREYDEYKDVYEYNKKGALVSVLTYWKGKITRTETYAYDADNRLSERVYIHDEGGEYWKDTKTYKYNDLGLLAEEKTIMKDSDSESKPSITTYAYTFY